MANKPLLVVSTGAGVSAESGVSTFRDNGGLWEQYDVMEVASAEGFARNPELIHRFYNERRRALAGVEPNAAHKALVELEGKYDVRVITQNVDDLHERAGSSNVLHLHGELVKVRSIEHPDKIYRLPRYDSETSTETVDGDGDHLRPHIVFFNEPVPAIEQAVELVRQADIFVVIGTSLTVYPAAGLLHYVRPGVPVYYIDPRPSDVPAGVHVIKATATEGMKQLVRDLGVE